MSFLILKKLSKNFGATPVVKGVDITVEKGEFVSLLGPSGCGKTTILRMVAGFDQPNSGEVFLNNRDITHLKPAQREIGMVFQDYALFPNMTVGENIGFGLKVAKKETGEIWQRVGEMLELVKLSGLHGRMPYQLSGGQQQRVALARALANRPRVLLLDEPLSALDAQIRISVRDEIKSLQKSLGITTLFVTHDQEEALAMSDRTVIINEGKVEQIDTPQNVYNQPQSQFVASFIGNSSTLEAEVVDRESKLLSIDQQVITATNLQNLENGQKITVSIRTEAFRVGQQSKIANTLSGQIVDISFSGSIIRLKIKLNTQTLIVSVFNQQSVKIPELNQFVNVNFEIKDLKIWAK